MEMVLEVVSYLDVKGKHPEQIKLWTTTAGASMLWCLETVRSSVNIVDKLAIAQRLQFRHMIGLKRRPCGHNRLEPWLDWHIRSLGHARDCFQSNCVSITQVLETKIETGRLIFRDLASHPGPSIFLKEYWPGGAEPGGKTRNCLMTGIGMC